MPLHRQVKEDLLLKIKNSTYKQGERLPSERSLAGQYGVSRVTIRNTINDLVRLGVLYSRRGSGTYVKSIHVESRLVSMTSGVEQLEKLGMNVDIEVLSAGFVRQDKLSRSSLELKDGDSVYRIVRCLSANGNPLLVSYVHTLPEVGKKIEKIDLKNAAFLSSLEEIGYQIQYAKEKIRAVRAEEFESKMLKLQPGSPLLCIERTVFISGDRPLYTNKDLINGDLYSLNILLQRNN